MDCKSDPGDLEDYYTLLRGKYRGFKSFSAEEKVIASPTLLRS